MSYSKSHPTKMYLGHTLITPSTTYYLYRLISLHTAPRHLRSSYYTVLFERSFHWKKSWETSLLCLRQPSLESNPFIPQNINTLTTTLQYKL